MKLNRRLNQVDSVASFMRFDSMENEEPFYSHLFRSNDSKPAMTVSIDNMKVDAKTFDLSMVFGRCHTHS